MSVARALLMWVWLVLMLPATASSQATGHKVPLPPGTKPIVPKLPKSRPAKSFPELAKDRNERALWALGYTRCLSFTIAAAQRGALGGIPPADLAVCVKEGTEWRGVFGQFADTKAGFNVRLQVVVPAGVISTASVDTANVAATARAMVRAASVPLPGDKVHPFIPVVMRMDSFYEVWFVPVQSDPARATVGGDSLIQMNSRGEKELGHTIHAPAMRLWSIVAGPSITLDSPEDEIPTVSEFMVANLALSMVNEVHVRTQRWEFVQTKTSGSWTPVPRVR